MWLVIYLDTRGFDTGLTMSGNTLRIATNDRSIVDPVIRFSGPFHSIFRLRPAIDTFRISFDMSRKARAPRSESLSHYTAPSKPQVSTKLILLPPSCGCEWSCRSRKSLECASGYWGPIYPAPGCPCHVHDLAVRHTGENIC